MSCNSECEPSECLVCLSTAIENLIFEGIQMEQEGEADEEWYQNALDVIRRENIDCYIDDMYGNDCEFLVYQYGINKAFELYKLRISHNIYISDDVNVCKKLLYCIVDDLLCVKYIDYQSWCETYPREEGE